MLVFQLVNVKYSKRHNINLFHLILGKTKQLHPAEQVHR